MLYFAYRLFFIRSNAEFVIRDSDHNHYDSYLDT